MSQLSNTVKEKSPKSDQNKGFWGFATSAYSELRPDEKLFFAISGVLAFIFTALILRLNHNQAFYLGIIVVFFFVYSLWIILSKTHESSRIGKEKRKVEGDFEDSRKLLLDKFNFLQESGGELKEISNELNQLRSEADLDSGFLTSLENRIKALMEKTEAEQAKINRFLVGYDQYKQEKPLDYFTDIVNQRRAQRKH